MRVPSRGSLARALSVARLRVLSRNSLVLSRGLLARSFSWLASVFSLVSRLCILSRDWLTRSLSWLACAFSLAARLRLLSRSSLLRSLAWLVCAFSLAARKRKWEACTHANHLHVLKSTQRATVIERYLN